MSEIAVAARLNALLAECGQAGLSGETGSKFEAYLGLILRWNARTNLTAIRDEDGIMRRHFWESIVCARVLPSGTGSLLDFGSGAGFPGIPIALCRPEIAVVLAESQGKKAAFLREAVRVLNVPVRVHSGRAEALDERFGCVVLRAVDKMAEAIAAAVGLIADGGWLGLLTTRSEGDQLKAVAGARFHWAPAVSLPDSDERILLLGRKVA